MEDRSRACDPCGANNIATADVCWQCLAPFAPAGHQPVSGPAPLATRPGGPPITLLGATTPSDTLAFVFAPEQSVRRVLELATQSYDTVRS
jgi:hypothetical protein